MSSPTISRRARRASDAATVFRGSRPTRWILSAVLVALAVVLATHLSAVSTFESHVLALWLGPLIDGGVVAVRDFFVVELPDAPLAFVVTPECSAVVLLVPVLGLAALMLLLRRIRIVRALVALVVAVAVVLATNQIRLALIAWSTQAWGMHVGYEISHKFVGSALGIIGFCLSAGILLLLASGKRKRRGRRATAAPTA